MNDSTFRNTVRASLVALASALALAGCGSSGEEQEQRCGGELVAIATGGLSCLGRSSGSSSPPPSPPPPVEPPPPSPPAEPRTVVMQSFEEYEPNSTFDNANPVNFVDGAPDQSIGVEMFGKVNQDGDPTDLFIFTPPRTGFYAIYLCGESCLEHPVTDEVYIAIYDQSQTTIASTPIGTAAEQFVGGELTAGLAYYVEVNGYNTGGTVFDYQLVVID